MEVVPQKRNRDTHAPTTRVYTRDSSAYAYAATPAHAPQPAYPPSRPAQRPKPTIQPAKPRTKAQAQPSFQTKCKVLCGIGLLAVTLIFILMRYANITREYSMINQLNEEINEIKLHLAELNVDLQCAMNIEHIQRTAQELGMAYPSSSQFVQVGSTLPAELLAKDDTAQEPDQDALPQDGDTKQPEDDPEDP